LNKRQALQTEKLKAAFAFFDRDNSGTISSKEVAELLGQNNLARDKEVWEHIISECDEDNSGEIDFNEF
jgi:calcium-dependent protein kinase